MGYAATSFVLLLVIAARAVDDDADSKSALLIMNPQPCFMPPNGTLAVTGMHPGLGCSACFPPHPYYWARLQKHKPRPAQSTWPSLGTQAVLLDRNWPAHATSPCTTLNCLPACRRRPHCPTAQPAVAERVLGPGFYDTRLSPTVSCLICLHAWRGARHGAPSCLSPISPLLVACIPSRLPSLQNCFANSPNF